MIAALAFSLALLQQDPQDAFRPEIGTQRETIMVVYKERSIALNGVPGMAKEQVSGSSLTYDRVGLMAYAVVDGGFGGVPCKVYTGDGKWIYKQSLKNTAITEYHTASYTMKFNVGLDGIPLHSESHFEDSTESKYSFVDVKADYRSDHIDVEVNRSGTVERHQIYPSFGMERFAAMFDPLIRSGLVQTPERDAVVLHPYTGMPYEFKIKVRQRFTGYYFSLPQAGYAIEIEGDEGNGKMYVTRQGQFIKVDLPNRHDCTLEMGPMYDERKGWGRFQLTDWDKSSEETNPERPKYNTLIVPVLFDKPKLLFPVPCVIAQ